MNDFNNDDFDDFEDDSFDNFDSGNSFKEMWQTSPLLKIFAVIAGIVVLVAAFMIFSGDGEEIQSRVANAPDNREVLGGEVSQSYADVLDEVNEQRLDRAVQTGRSTIPMLVNPEEQDLLVQIEEAPPYEEFDPLATFREVTRREREDDVVRPNQPAQVEEEPVLVAPETFVQQPVQQIAPAPNPAAVQALAQAMAQDVSGILANHDPVAARLQTVTPIDFYDVQQTPVGTGQTGNQNMSGAGFNDLNGNGIPDDIEAAQVEPEIIQNILIPAGEINYAQIMVEANSDVPGPVLAQLMSGPLVGARVLGSFTVEDEYLVLSFNTIVIDGISTSISAVAIDPDTTLPGVATSVNRRYWQRVFLPAAARFVEGIGSAIAEDTQTTVTVSGDTVIEEQNALDVEQELGRGVEEGFEEIAEFMDEEADDIQVQVRVSRGTPIGILFTEPVIEAQ